MLDADRGKFAKLLGAHARSLGRELEADALELHFKACSDLTFEQWKRGLAIHVSDPERCRFLPQPGDIRRALGALTPEEKADRAWTVALDAIRRSSPWDSVVFEDRAITASLMNMGGWINAAQWYDDELVWRRKDFIRLYTGFVASGVPKSTPAKLLGLHERDNGVKGYLGSPAYKHLAGHMAPVELVGEGARLLLDEAAGDKTGEVLAKLGEGLPKAKAPEQEFKPSDLVKDLLEPKPVKPLEALSEEEWERRKREQIESLKAIEDANKAEVV